ncbi:hypothetical protein Pcinc_018138 [Petrolisthes cinctipes]|uniref:Uncharacterized protein n=1 Tax=Petrolisthes cinctipes TaxID=88211 RepID=A0AAE1KMU1_PETCI|nr:hypothetical protein Pcinc_018138 [Petrolisthes cinctipes]
MSLKRPSSVQFSSVYLLNRGFYCDVQQAKKEWESVYVLRDVQPNPLMPTTTTTLHHRKVTPTLTGRGYRTVFTCCLSSPQCKYNNTTSCHLLVGSPVTTT